MSQITVEQKLKILNCEKISELKAILNAEQLKYFLSLPYPAPAKRENKFTRSAYAFLNAISTPIDVLSLVLAASEVILVSALPIITPIALGASLIMAGIYFWKTSKRAAQQSLETQDFFQLTQLKMQMADELIESLEADIGKLANNRAEEQQILSRVKAIKSEINHIDKKPELPSKLSAALVGMTTLGILTATIYYNISLTLGVYGLLAASAALTGFVGIGIAVLAASVIGIYTAYQYYQRGKVLNEIASQKESKTCALNLKTKKCQQLLTIKETLKILTPQPALESKDDITPPKEPEPQAVITPTVGLMATPALLFNSPPKLEEPLLTGTPSYSNSSLSF